jgi:hypothetical protein
VSVHCAAGEAEHKTYLIGVTDGNQAWVVQFSKLSVTGYQWPYGPVLSAPAGDTNNPYPQLDTNEWNTTAQVCATTICKTVGADPDVLT